MGASIFGVYPCTMFYMGVLCIHLMWASCIAYLSGWREGHREGQKVKIRHLLSLNFAKLGISYVETL